MYLYILQCIWWTDDRVSGVVIKLWTGLLRNHGSIPSKGKRLYSPPNTQTNCRICLGSYCAGTRGFISGSKAAGMWSWPIPSPCTKVRNECSSAYMPPICLYVMHREFTFTACQEYLQQHVHGQHLELNNIFVMYQCHNGWQQAATLQNFVQPYWHKQQFNIPVNHRSLDSPSVSKRDKCPLTVTSILDAC